MANVASKFGIGNRGRDFSEPWRLGPGWAIPATVLDVTEISGPTNRTSATSNFWTLFANQGTAVDSDYTSGTYKTLLSVASGKGRVATLVGPTAGGAETTTFEITRDGVLTEIAILVASGQRAVLGIVGDVSGTLGIDNYIINSAAFNAGKTIQTVSGSVLAFLLPWQFINNNGMAVMDFTTSLLIRAKHSANVTGTASQERQSGVIHMNGL